MATNKNKPLPKKDHLAPFPLPTGKKPSDCLQIIWRKNETFMDISHYNIGSIALIIWFQFILYAGGVLIMELTIGDTYRHQIITSAIFFLFLSIFIISVLKRPTPLPIRFNRQRREVCVLKENGEYWFAPWEEVIASAPQSSIVTQGGRMRQGFLYIRLNNPAAADNEDDHHALMFSCGGGETAMALWECIRTYMEVGPDAVPDPAVRFSKHPGVLANFVADLKKQARRKGWFLTLLWDGLGHVLLFNVLLADYLEQKKLYPLPDLDHPDIIEWSKSLPPEQWARPSAEFQAALAEQQARRVA